MYNKRSFLLKFVGRPKDQSSEARVSKAKAKAEVNLHQVKAKAKVVQKAGVKAFPDIVVSPHVEKEKGKDVALKAKEKGRAEAKEWAKMVFQFAKDQIVPKILTKAIILILQERAVLIEAMLLL